MPPPAAVWHVLDTILLRSAPLESSGHKAPPPCPSSDPADQAGWSKRLLEAEEAGPAPDRRPSAGQHLHGDMTSDPNTGQSPCSGLQLSPGRAALRRAFTGPETRRAETEQEDTSSRLRPRPRQSWSHSPHQSWSSSSAPSSGHLQLSSARCAGQSHRPCHTSDQKLIGKRISCQNHRNNSRQDCAIKQLRKGSFHWVCMCDKSSLQGKWLCLIRSS